MTVTVDATATGYLSHAYASTLGVLGVPRVLEASAGCVLERAIPRSVYRDAIGCYPFFACRHWNRLSEDLSSLTSDLVALSIVTDPFGEQNPDTLRTLFPDLVVPFKQHYVIDLERFDGRLVDAHHRRNERKGLANVLVERVAAPPTAGSDWVTLYSSLIERHQIRGLAAFSEATLRAQLAVPGTVLFKASRDGESVGMTVWYVQGETGHYHLAAYSQNGYEWRASYALFSTAVRYFKDSGLRWLGLGAAAGLQEDQSSGLTRFKRGWATGTRTVYLCGRIFDRAAYKETTVRTGTSHSTYFPAYREGEFG